MVVSSVDCLVLRSLIWVCYFRGRLLTCLIIIVSNFFSFTFNLNIRKRLLILCINLFLYNLNSFNFIFYLIRLLLRLLPFRRFLSSIFTRDHLSNFFVILRLRLLLN